MGHFRSQKLRTRRKKLRQFHFSIFHEPLVKRGRDSLKIPGVNLARENLGWDEHEISLFRVKMIKMEHSARSTIKKPSGLKRFC